MKIEAIDITLSEVQSGGTAYYRIDDNMIDFLKRCLGSGEIIGFTWDSDDPRNFGVIMAEKTDRVPA